LSTDARYKDFLIIKVGKKVLISEFMSYLKGKSALFFFDRHPEIGAKWGEKHLWARGYYVSTVGNVNEETIREYIREQEENDKMGVANFVKLLLLWEKGLFN